MTDDFRVVHDTRRAEGIRIEKDAKGIIYALSDKGFLIKHLTARVPADAFVSPSQDLDELAESVRLQLSEEHPSHDFVVLPFDPDAGAISLGSDAVRELIIWAFPSTD